MAIIKSTSNPKIKLIKSLARRKKRHETGKFIVEGLSHIGEAIAAGWDIDFFVYPENFPSESYLNELIDFCGDLGGKALIFGSPKQRNTVGISIDEAKGYFADGLAAVADHAQARGVQVLIEPLDKTQTDVVNVTAEALELVKKINHPAIATMFDFHNTLDETDDFVAIIKKYHKHIHHVHVQEMDGQYLGTGNARQAFVAAFQTLKDLGYDKWVSLEVFDFSPGGKVIAEESMKVLKAIEAELV